MRNDRCLKRLLMKKPEQSSSGQDALECLARLEALVIDAEEVALRLIEKNQAPEEAPFTAAEGRQMIPAD